MSHQEANLFLQVISSRHNNGRPTVVATSKSFREWNHVFLHNGTAHAMVDRLTERTKIFYPDGKSYRATHRKGIETKQTKTPSRNRRKA